MAGSVLCACWRWMCKFSRQVRGIVRLRVVVELNVAVTSGVVWGAGIAELLARAASRLAFGRSLVRNAIVVSWALGWFCL